MFLSCCSYYRQRFEAFLYPQLSVLSTGVEGGRYRSADPTASPLRRRSLGENCRILIRPGAEEAPARLALTSRTTSELKLPSSFIITRADIKRGFDRWN